MSADVIDLAAARAARAQRDADIAALLEKLNRPRVLLALAGLALLALLLRGGS